MTVKEVIGILDGAREQLTISVWYNSEEYDITEPSPVQDAFADYVVEGVCSVKPHEFKISLKQEYVKAVTE